MTPVEGQTSLKDSTMKYNMMYFSNMMRKVERSFIARYFPCLSISRANGVCKF